jgi:hypothetical protein
MADHRAISAVTRSLGALLGDRMEEAATVTFAPPDVIVADVAGPRVNLYLMQVLESAALKNQDLPERAHAGEYGRPPLTLTLRYLLTTHSASETQPEADLNAQRLLGDAMRVLHDFGPRLHGLMSRSTPPVRLLDEALRKERDRVKVSLYPASLDDVAKLWSAAGEAAFRRSVVYDVDLVRILTPEPRRRARPVEERRIMASVRRRPVILDAYAVPGPGERPGERRVRIGDEIRIEGEQLPAERLYVRLGRLDPIRVAPSADGIVHLVVPDDLYPVDLDHGSTRPIPTAAQLLPGPLEITLIAVEAGEGIAGGAGAGRRVVGEASFRSDAALLQLVPTVTAVASIMPPAGPVVPAAGGPGTIIRVTGARLWHPGARAAEVMVGDAGIAIRAPRSGEPWAAPTPTQVEVPFADAAPFLPVQAAGDPPYAVAVQVDGARSRGAFGFARTS